MDNLDEAELFRKLATAIGTTSEDVYSLHETERNQLLIATGLKIDLDSLSKRCTKNSKGLRGFDYVPSPEEDSLGFDLVKATTSSRSSLRSKITSSNSPSTSSSSSKERIDPQDKKEVKEIDLAEQVSIVEQIHSIISKKLIFTSSELAC